MRGFPYFGAESVDMKSMIVAIAVLFSVVAADAAPGVNVMFDKRTGAWTGLYVKSHNMIAGVGADVGISWAGGQLPPISEWKLISIEKKDATTTVTRQGGDWEIRTETSTNGFEIRRKATFKWNGEKPAKVVGTSLKVPCVRISDSSDDYYVIPSSFPVARHKFSSLKTGTSWGEGFWVTGEYSIAAVHSPENSASIIVGYLFGMDDAGVSVEEGNESINISHNLGTAAILKPGSEIDCGTQIIRIVGGDELQMLSSISKLSNDIGNGPPDDRPEYLKKCVLYEAHPWGRLEMWKDPDRGNRYSRLTSLLPYYKNLGVTSLWILPVSWPPPWVYTLTAFDRIDPQNGTPEELKALVNGAHALDIKMLIDLVTYGINPKSEEIAKLPDDCWCYDEDGKRDKAWGGAVLAADCSSPDWQAKISEVATHWAKDFGFDGTRLDVVGWGQAYNWKNPMRANASMAYGGIQLNGVIRKSMRAVNPNAVELPEGGKPLVFKNADMVFGYPLYSQMRNMTMNPNLAQWIANVREWLEFERHCYPSRGLPGIVRFLENHDTVSAAEYFGVGPSQALMAIVSLIQGTPLIYQEQETGFSKDLSAWLKLRNSEECFYGGEASYTCVNCSNPDVFCFLRICKSGAAVVAINMTCTDVECEISWPQTVRLAFPDVYSAFSGKKVSCPAGWAKARIPAFRPEVFLLKRRGETPAVSSYDLVDSASRLNAEPVKSDSPVDIENAKRWFVQTDEGYLEDDFNNLAVKLRPGESAVDALPVLERAWNPLAGGLMDGAVKASMGVISGDGKVTRVEFDPRGVSDAKIVDAAGDGKSAEIVVARANSEQQHSSDSGVSKWMEITPQFINLKTGNRVLSLARRHGGLPVAWTENGVDGASIISPADVYTDSGIFANKLFASADGETNPRLSIETTQDYASVTFTGKLHERSWNGFQTCGIPGPVVQYRLSYRVDSTAGVTVTLGLMPSVDVPNDKAFFAFKLPFASFGDWKAVGGNGAAADSSQGRLSESKTSGAGTYEITAAGCKLHIDSFSDFQNVFITTDGALYLALLDGGQRDLKAGQEISASAKISIGN